MGASTGQRSPYLTAGGVLFCTGLFALATCGCEAPMAPTPTLYTCEVLRGTCGPLTGLPEGIGGGICILRIERVVQSTPCEPWADPKVRKRRRPMAERGDVWD